MVPKIYAYFKGSWSFLNPINFQHPALFQAIMRARFNEVVTKPQRANSNIDEDWTKNRKNTYDTCKQASNMLSFSCLFFVLYSEI